MSADAKATQVFRTLCPVIFRSKHNTVFKTIVVLELVHDLPLRCPRILHPDIQCKTVFALGEKGSFFHGIDGLYHRFSEIEGIDVLPGIIQRFRRQPSSFAYRLLRPGNTPEYTYPESIRLSDNPSGPSFYLYFFHTTIEQVSSYRFRWGDPI